MTMRMLDADRYLLNMDRVNYVVWHHDDNPPWAELHFAGEPGHLSLRGEAYQAFHDSFTQDWQLDAEQVTINVEQVLSELTEPIRVTVTNAHDCAG